jgi:hypothetical protein
MRELLDKPSVEKFAFPGLHDRSVVKQMIEEPTPMPEIQEDVKKPRKKKEPAPATAAAPVGRKPLKLGKAKG